MFFNDYLGDLFYFFVSSITDSFIMRFYMPQFIKIFHSFKKQPFIDALNKLSYSKIKSKLKRHSPKYVSQLQKQSLLMHVRFLRIIKRCNNTHCYK